MRVLLTCLPEHGHFHPMVPLARALVNAGHAVAFATAEDYCDRVRRAGFAAFPAGLSHAEQIQEAERCFPGPGGLPRGQERFLAFVPRMVAGVAAPARALECAVIIESWRPDIVVHDEVELAAPVVAAAAGLPHVAHGVGMIRPMEALNLAGEVLRPLCESWGVDLGPLGGLFRYLYLDVCPPSLQRSHARQLPTVHSIDVSGFDGVTGEDVPEWVGALPDLPTVYVTMGTVFKARLGVLASVLEGVRDEAVNVVVTVGHQGDPEMLGPQPANVHVERYIPQSLLLPKCDAVVTHGGWSMFGMLAHGLPMLLLPQAASQFWHAEACAAAGAARRLDPSQVSPESVQRGLRALLEQASYRRCAVDLQRQIEAMPRPNEGVRLLEALQGERCCLGPRNSPGRRW